MSLIHVCIVVGCCRVAIFFVHSSGWCGTTTGHCSTGCQAGFGACSGTPAPPPATPSPRPTLPPASSVTCFRMCTDWVLLCVSLHFRLVWHHNRALQHRLSGWLWCLQRHTSPTPCKPMSTCACVCAEPLAVRCLLISGWCGTTTGHCSTGCQAGFGACSGTPAPPPANPSPSPTLPPASSPSPPPAQGGTGTVAESISEAQFESIFKHRNDPACECMLVGH
jgi:hypothetical protein